MIQQAFALGLQRHPTLRCFSKEPQHLRIGPLNYKAPLAREKKKKKNHTSPLPSLCSSAPQPRHHRAALRWLCSSWRRLRRRRKTALARPTGSGEARLEKPCPLARQPARLGKLRKGAARSRARMHACLPRRALLSAGLPTLPPAGADNPAQPGAETFAK